MKSKGLTQVLVLKLSKEQKNFIKKISLSKDISQAQTVRDILDSFMKKK